MFVKFFTIFIVFLFFFTFISVGAEEQNIIEPGVKIGTYYLNVSIDDIIKVMGKADKSTGDSFKTCYFNRYGFIFGFKDGKALTILITSNYYHTKDGFKVGSSVTDVKKIFKGGYDDIVADMANTPGVTAIECPVPNTYGTYTCMKEGIAFTYNKAGKVIGINIFSPR